MPKSLSLNTRSVGLCHTPRKANKNIMPLSSYDILDSGNASPNYLVGNNNNRGNDRFASLKNTGNYRIEKGIFCHSKKVPIL
jgi:hypothetical protein